VFASAGTRLVKLLDGTGLVFFFSQGCSKERNTLRKPQADERGRGRSVEIEIEREAQELACAC